MYRTILSFLILGIVLIHLQLVGAGKVLHQCLANCNLVTIANNDTKIMDNQKKGFWQTIANIWNTKEEKIKRNGNEKLPCPITESTLVDSWNYYKKTFISDDGRVIDHQRDSITTSEGQAYAMRRALIIRDKETFDKTYNWSKYNLQHKDDHLFAWLWGQQRPTAVQGEIKYGIIDNNGATDAGVEIADCLILASRVWHQQSYMEDAKKIINDIWDKETFRLKGQRILSAGIKQNRAQIVEVNPSYFMINSFKTFAKVDKTHNWKSVVNSSYKLTDWCISHIPSGLPPDIFYINKKTGAITFDKDKSDFSYDALRVFYRFYVDYMLTGDKRDLPLLSKTKFFINRWKQEGKFYTNYKQNGELKDYNEPIGSIALLLPVINFYDKNAAKKIYISRIQDKYNNEGYCGDQMDYYAQNLVWFGLWLYLNEKNVQIYKY